MNSVANFEQNRTLSCTTILRLGVAATIPAVVNTGNIEAPVKAQIQLSFRMVLKLLSGAHDGLNANTRR
jgi:hypothetical protein